MKTKAKNTKKCLVPDCGKSVNSRGLCSTCYQNAQSMIKSGKTTWKKLEKSGKVLPRATTREGDSKFSKWVNS